MKIICVGRNYADHAKEMNNEIPKEPVLFLKPETAIIRNNLPFFYPDFSKNIHYEVEIILRVNKLGKNIQEKFAHTYYNEIGLGIDFTARDLQKQLKEKGLPWEKAKGFDGSALISDFIPKDKFKNLENLDFRLEKNQETVQKGNTANMIFTFDRLVEEISKYFTLKIGDLIFTGTPAGVGHVNINDTLTGYLEDRKMFEVAVK